MEANTSRITDDPSWLITEGVGFLEGASAALFVGLLAVVVRRLRRSLIRNDPSAGSRFVDYADLDAILLSVGQWAHDSTTHACSGSSIGTRSPTIEPETPQVQIHPPFIT
ncbi:MAG: hypothetical protein [Circular genetic element sp.]|nr:MAG: hypothetical protein [Circular genetic element sp.]